MPRFLLFCLLSSQLAVAAVAARPFAVFVLPGGADGAAAADAPSAAPRARSLLESRFAGSPLSSHHGQHSPFDRTFAGGKIIVAGLAAAIVVAVFCYIRITRRAKPVEVEPKV